jgi:hypothetical protein
MAILEGLETIDDELDTIRISFVQTRDEDYLFKAHEIEILPAIGLYRNKNFLVRFNSPVLETKFCSGTCKVRSKLAQLRKMYKKISVTKRPSLCRSGVASSGIEFCFKSRPRYSENPGYCHKTSFRNF